MTDVTSLATIPLFDAFDEAELQRLSDAAVSRSLERNDAVFNEGDHPSELFVVLSGRIAISKSFIDGRESVLAFMTPGDLFGEMGLFGGRGRSADARALEPSTVAAIAYAPILEIYDARPQLLWQVAGLLADRLRHTDEALADTMFLDVTGRTAKRILEMSNGDEVFSLPITQEELAGMVGASRERVNKALSSFQKLGWLEQSDRRYRILDREALERRAM